MRVTAPNSLTTNVHIETSADALEFVRFFTTRRTFPFNGVDGFVEIVLKTPDGYAAEDFYVPRPDPKWFHPPIVTKYRGEIDGSDFQVDRFMVSLDGVIYHTRELITSEGDYRLVSREKIAAAGDFGIVHVGNI